MSGHAFPSRRAAAAGAYPNDFCYPVTNELQCRSLSCQYQAQVGMRPSRLLQPPSSLSSVF